MAPASLQPLHSSGLAWGNAGPSGLVQPGQPEEGALDSELQEERGRRGERTTNCPPHWGGGGCLGGV